MVNSFYYFMKRERLRGESIVRERVGSCTQCKKSIYCLDGFLDGVISENQKLYCFPCYERSEVEASKT
jgi:hypothetical protein